MQMQMQKTMQIVGRVQKRDQGVFARVVYVGMVSSTGCVWP